MARISARWRLNTFSIASEISPTLALARAASGPMPQPEGVEISEASRVLSYEEREHQPAVVTLKPTFLGSAPVAS